MNERNARAIAEAIRAYLDDDEPGSSHYIDLGGYDRPGDGGGLDHLARFLASRGVLAVESLTDDECGRVAEDQQLARIGEPSTANPPDTVRRELARVARGGEEG